LGSAPSAESLLAAQAMVDGFVVPSTSNAPSTAAPAYRNQSRCGGHGQVLLHVCDLLAQLMYVRAAQQQ